jgi:m7GpppX diphosphatase
MSGEKVLDEKYGLKRGAARFFIHYQPSYYHFHVHIVSLSNEGLSGADVGKAHLMDDVISLVRRQVKCELWGFHLTSIIAHCS